MTSRTSVSSTEDGVADQLPVVAALWEKCLGSYPQSSSENFFDIGGDSLRATQLLSWLRRDLGVELSLLDIFEHPEIGDLAAHVAGLAGPGSSDAAGSETEYFFFGPPKRRLFGALHSPRTTPAQERAPILLCYPIGQEYMRIHRTYVELARALSATGRRVFRFDYSGSGDSFGDAPGDLGPWVDDIAEAVEEVRRLTGRTDVVLVGARIGANLVLDAVAAGVAASRVVLWEPVVDGSAYLQSLRRAHARMLEANANLAGYPQLDRPDCVEELLGFPVSRTLHDQLCAIDLRSLGKAPAVRDVLILEHSPKDGLQRLAERLEAGCDVSLVNADESDGIWLKEDRQNKGMIPVHAVEAVVSWVSAAAL